MSKFIIYFIESLKYVIHFYTGQPQVTAKDSEDGVFGDLTAAGATAAWKIANVVLGGCGLTHAGADLQKFGNLGDGAGPLYASNSGPVSNGRLAKAGVATTQNCGLPKENANQIKEGDCQTDFRTNKRAKVAKWTGSEVAAARATGRSSECPNPTTCLTAVAVTWTSEPDATSTSLVMSSSSTTPSSFDLASLIYSTFIHDHLKSNSNLELNLYKNLFRKFVYPQLILFLDNALFAQLHSYKSLDSVISSSLRFLGF